MSDNSSIRLMVGLPTRKKRVQCSTNTFRSKESSHHLQLKNQLIEIDI